jgi:hypothetical protein
MLTPDVDWRTTTCTSLSPQYKAVVNEFITQSGCCGTDGESLCSSGSSSSPGNSPGSTPTAGTTPSGSTPSGSNPTINGNSNKNIQDNTSPGGKKGNSSTADDEGDGDMFLSTGLTASTSFELCFVVMGVVFSLISSN